MVGKVADEVRIITKKYCLLKYLFFFFFVKINTTYTILRPEKLSAAAMEK